MSRTRALQFSKYILEGKFLAIDPSSGKTGNAGWALFEKGKLHSSGILDIYSDSSRERRLKSILECMQKEFEPVDLLVLENIEGRMAPKILIQACGVIIAGTPSDRYFEMNIITWQSIAMKLGGWKKTNKNGVVRGDPKGNEGDEYDAQYIGFASIALALGYDAKSKPEFNDPIIENVKSIIKESKDA